MKIMDLIIEEIKKDNPDIKIGQLKREPVQIIETPTGIIHKDIKTGKFTKK